MDYICEEGFFMLEINKIHCGDSCKHLKEIQDKFIDLTVTSPPYDNLRDYKGYSFEFETIAKELYRITKDGGVVVWIVGDQTLNGSETGTSFRQALYFMEIGFNLHDTMIYQKSGLTFPETNRYYPCFEYMFILSKGKPKTTNLIADKKNLNVGGTGGTFRQPNGELKKGYGHKIKEYGVRPNVWIYDTGLHKTTKDRFAFEHPASFPEKLAKDHIISWSNEEDLVLDPFVGSGTTCKIAKLQGRKFIGIDISEEYCKIAKKRIRQESLLPLAVNTKEDGFPPTPKGMGIQPTIL